MPAKGHSETKYKGSMNQEIIDMFAQGKGREDFCARHRISEKTFSLWLRTYPEFKESYEIAIPVGKTYYFGIAQDHLVEDFEGSKLNVSLFNRIIHARFNIPDKKRLKVDGISKARTVEGKIKKILLAIENEEVTSEEVRNLMSLIDTSIKSKEHGEILEKIKQLEEAQHVGFDKKEFDEVPDQELKQDV